MTNEQKALVEANQKLVFGVINKKFPWLAFDDDAVSCGYVGLCKAAQAFDPNKGFSFTTFAYPCIYNQIAMYLRDKLKHQEHNTTMTFETEEKDGEGEFFEIVGQEDASFEQFEISEDVKKAIDKLPQRHKEVIVDYMNGKSFREMAKKYKISHQGAFIKFQRTSRLLKERLNGYD